LSHAICEDTQCDDCIAIPMPLRSAMIRLLLKDSREEKARELAQLVYNKECLPNEPEEDTQSGALARAYLFQRS
jgi:hypothetical protein